MRRAVQPLLESAGASAGAARHLVDPPTALAADVLVMSVAHLEPGAPSPSSMRSSVPSRSRSSANPIDDLQSLFEFEFMRNAYVAGTAAAVTPAARPV